MDEKGKGSGGSKDNYTWLQEQDNDSEETGQDYTELEGYGEGYAAGYAKGYEMGYAKGYHMGFVKGISKGSVKGKGNGEDGKGSVKGKS